MAAKQTEKNIPNGWNDLELGSLGETFGGLTGKSKNDFGTGKPYVSYMNVYSNARINPEMYELVQVSEGEKQNTLEYGDVLFTTSSETADEVGVASVFLEEPKVAIYLNSFCFGLRLKNQKVLLPKYAQYYFRGPIYRDAMTRIAQGASRYNLSKKYFLKSSIIIPADISEQKRIVAVLEMWDRTIEKLTRKIELKKDVKKGLMQNLLTGKLRLPGFKDEWQTEKFGNLFTERNERGTLGLSLLSITSDRGVIRQSDSNKKDTSNSDKSKYLRIRPGDIGYNTMRLWQGRSALSNMDGLISPAYTILTPNENVDSRYFAYLFKLPRIVNFFFQKSQGLVSDTWQCRYRDFSIIRYPVPEFEEQKAIADILTAADSEIADLTKKISILNDQKKYLLNNLISGTIRTPENLTIA